MDKLIVLLVICHLFSDGTSQMCENWISVPTNDFNRTSIDINDPNANEVRPLGFLQTTLRFQGKRPCYTVSNLAGNGRHIEIKWELGLAGTLCVTDDVSNNEQCSSSMRNPICSTVPEGRDTVTYTFLCEGSNCESGDVQFWFRFLVESPDAEMTYDENWCMTLDSLYPSSISEIASITPPTTTMTTSGAGVLVSSVVLLFLTSVMLLF